MAMCLIFGMARLLLPRKVRQSRGQDQPVAIVWLVRGEERDMRFGLFTSMGAQSWSGVLELWRHLEATGWDIACVTDHFMPNTKDREGAMLESWSTLSALAALVPRLRVGTIVLGNTYRHPAVVAKMAAQVDIISGGRLLLGLGAGWQENEHEAYGQHGAAHYRQEGRGGAPRRNHRHPHGPPRRRRARHLPGRHPRPDPRAAPAAPGRRGRRAVHPDPVPAAARAAPRPRPVHGGDRPGVPVGAAAWTCSGRMPMPTSRAGMRRSSGTRPSSRPASGGVSGREPPSTEAITRF